MKKIIIIISILLIIIITPKNHKILLDKENYKYSYEIINSQTLNKKLKQKHSFVLYTYNSYCSFPVHCEKIFKKELKKQNIKLYGTPFNNVQKTKIYQKLKYAPSIIIIEKGKVKYYLDPNSKKDYKIFQNQKHFNNWIKSKIK